MIHATQLSFSYTRDRIFRFPDLNADEYNPLLITGKSGSGKTTLLHLLGKLLTPSTGTVVVDGTDLTKLKGQTADLFRGRYIGLIFQKHHLVASATVLDNLLLPLYFSRAALSTEAAKRLAARLQIDHLLKRKPSQLSLGEQQRVCIARAIIHGPKLVLADEPTSSLDDDNAETVIALLKEQASESGSTLIVVSHDERLKQHFLNQIQL